MEPQIITGAERADTSSGEPLMTFSQLQSLLREAAAVERAQRPIYIMATDPVVVPPTGHVPPGYVSATVEVEPGPPWAPTRKPAAVRLWGAKLGYAGIAAALAGAAGAAGTDGDALSVASIIAGLVACGVAVARVNRETDLSEGRQS